MSMEHNTNKGGGQGGGSPGDRGTGEPVHKAL